MSLIDECRALLPDLDWSPHQDAQPGEPSMHGWEPCGGRCSVVVTAKASGLYHVEVSYHHELVKQGPHGKREEWVNTSGDAVAETLRDAYVAACEEYAIACSAPRPMARTLTA